MNSKALKRAIRHVENYGFLFWLKSVTIWPISDCYSRYSERIKRSLAFAKFGWLNYDFDAHTVWGLLSFKLKRIYPVLLKGHAIQEEDDMKALLEAISICERLDRENYEGKYLDAHDFKYGKIKSRHDRVASLDANGKVLSYYYDQWRDGVNKENEEQERVEFRECFESAEKDLQADVDRLFYILKNHLRSWWD